MATVQLTQGKVALIDDADLELVSQYKWFHARSGTGYAQNSTRENGRTRSIQMHRLIMSPAAGMFVDHINGDTLDNRRSNLRVCTRTENARNRRGTNKHGFKGVYKVDGKFQATIYKDGHNKSLGYYATVEAAARAYNQAAIEYFGDFARTNLIGT